MLQELAERSEGFTGADLAALVREAALAALTENLDADIVTQIHFDQAFKVVPKKHRLSAAILCSISGMHASQRYADTVSPSYCDWGYCGCQDKLMLRQTLGLPSMSALCIVKARHVHMAKQTELWPAALCSSLSIG